MSFVEWLGSITGFIIGIILGILVISGILFIAGARMGILMMKEDCICDEDTFPYGVGDNRSIHFTKYDNYTLFSFVDNDCGEINSSVENRRYFYCEEALLSSKTGDLK